MLKTWILKIVLIASIIGVSSAVMAQEKNGFDNKFWQGHNLRTSIGFIADEIRHSKPDGSKVMIRGNATFFYGYEYGYQFFDHWYWSLGLEWTIAYPRNFLSMSSTLKKTLAWLQPLNHARIGYVFNNHALLTLGLTYFWALSLNFRIPLGQHLYFETQYLQWFDGIIGLWKLAPSLGAAFDFANFSLGVGWKF